MIEERDWVDEPLQILSMGGGVQSSAMLLLIMEGKLPKPDVVVFSDTGSEMPYTYEHMKRVEACCDEIGIPFVTVGAKVKGKEWKLHEYYLDSGTMPVKVNRSCTTNFKIRPIRRWARTIVGDRNGVLLCQSWLGITTDEAHRAKHPAEPIWAGVSCPLIDNDISRRQCVSILKRHGWDDVKKSGCFCCPFHSRTSWSKLAKTNPDLFEISSLIEAGKLTKFGGEGYLGDGLVLSYVDPPITLADFGMEFDAVPEWENSACDGFGGCFL